MRDFADGGLDAFVGIGGQQLDAAKALAGRARVRGPGESERDQYLIQAKVKEMPWLAPGPSLLGNKGSNPPPLAVAPSPLKVSLQT